MSLQRVRLELDVAIFSTAACHTDCASILSVLTFCWRHSLHARFTAVLRRDEDGRVSPSPFSCSSSVEAERLKPRCTLVGEVARECWWRPCTEGVGENSMDSMAMEFRCATAMSAMLWEPTVRRLARLGGSCGGAPWDRRRVEIPASDQPHRHSSLTAIARAGKPLPYSHVSAGLSQAFCTNPPNGRAFRKRRAGNCPDSPITLRHCSQTRSPSLVPRMH